ncbi:hypothetical protein [Enterococcus casseliflavus]|uniref:hypothetical protein n=1 Tax=Enterococcus casseliflavus TaxID=37734 RepID=UPI000354112A|nr:hypothetical protein [Enterococcus casseliflavus]EPH93272.1 hypothetical protein D922_01813 [Enterococcus faecalis 06-MB-DW-09]OTO34083.1 hypothetical protein A5870_001434 [Enterococcus sp. 2G9_DIV0600]OTO38671.1 hypothetical protein A5871_003257 [Enterococcus sp. 2F9_DIV0599]
MNQESEEYPLWRVLLVFVLFLVVMGVSFYFFRSTGVLLMILVLLAVSHIFNREG